MAQQNVSPFQSLVSKNKSPFVQSVYKQFLLGKKLSEKQMEIIDEIAIKEGLSPIFSSSTHFQSAVILPVLSLNRDLGRDPSLFEDAVKDMWSFVGTPTILDSLRLEKPVWVKKYLEKRDNVFIMNTDSFDLGNLKLISFFSKDINVLLNSNRNLVERKMVLRLMGTLYEILDIYAKKRIPNSEIQHLLSSLIVALDDLRYREEKESIFLKNIDPSKSDLSEYILDLFMEYKELLKSLTT